MVVQAGHLPPGPSLETLLGLADVVLELGGHLFLSHTQIMCLEGEHFANLLGLQAEDGPCVEWRGRSLPVVPVAPQAAPPGGLSWLQEAEPHFQCLLRTIYRTSVFEWESIAGVLQLADYFGAAGVLARADAWLCQLSRGAHEPEAACLAFELAARHRLGSAMAALLPWAVQCMALGSRCSAVWYDGEQRCSRLKAAFEDSQLKCLVLDAYWWSREAKEACPACACLPADVAASWETRQEWATPAAGAARGAWGGSTTLPPGMQARAVQHYAHLLEQARWGCTPIPAAAAGATPRRLATQ